MMIPDPDHNKTVEWVKTWAKTGPLLDQIRQRELRQMTYEQRITAIASVMQISSPASASNVISGLVEQQRLFRKARQ